MYLVSRERIARLQKTLSFSVFPRLREFIKVRNRELGDDYFQVVQITHREGDAPELWIHTTSFVDGKTLISFFPEEELEEYITGYEKEGWALVSQKPNKIFREDGSSIWSDIAASLTLTDD